MNAPAKIDRHATQLTQAEAIEPQEHGDCQPAAVTGATRQSPSPTSGLGPSGECHTIAVDALNRILSLRPPGDVDTCKSPRELVKQIECIASQALVRHAMREAAAPELLEALRGAVGALEFSRDYHNDLGNEEQAFAQDRLDAAVKAIAKAEGRS